MKTREATILALAVFLAIAIAAASSNPVFAQYTPCTPGYSYNGGSCYPTYNNPYNPYNNCQSGYYNPSYGCSYPSYSNPYNYYPYNYYYGNSYRWHSYHRWHP